MKESARGREEVGRVQGISETQQRPAGKNSVFSSRGIRSQCSQAAVSNVFLCVILESETADVRGSSGESGGRADPAWMGTVARGLSLETKVSSTAGA